MKVRAAGEGNAKTEYWGIQGIDLRFYFADLLKFHHETNIY